ncbi:MAG: glycosyltransferase family 4 protein [Chryseolinea sp.]
MKEKPCILIIENAIDITGSLNSCLRSSIYLRDQYEFLFILPTRSKAVELVTREGFRVFPLPMIEIRKSLKAIARYLPQLIRNAIALRKLIRSNQVDLILNNDFYNLLPAAYEATGGRTPYVCYVRFMPSKFSSSLVRFWYSAHTRYAKKIIAVSQAVKSELPHSDKLVVIGNELPLKPEPLTESTSKMILYPSNFIQGKGHEWAVKAFAEVATEFPDWKIRFIGSDMGLEKNAVFKSMLKNLAHQLRIETQVEWLNYDDNVVMHYQACSMMLNFSESESFSMTCLEAMFYGRPVIATRSGGPEEIIIDGQNGLLVDLGNLSQMAAALRRLLTSQGTRQQFGVAAYHHVRQKFSAANTIEKLSAVYQSSLLK